MKLNILMASAILPLMLAVPGLASAATTFNFSYLESSGVTVSGVLRGSFEADKNTFDVYNTAQSISVNGIAETVGFGVYSFNDPGATPIVTLDGSKLDLWVMSDDLSFYSYLIFAVNDPAASSHGGAFTDATPSLGGSYADEAFVPANFSASFNVPEPSAWMLMIAGLAAIGAALRSGRRSRSGDRLTPAKAQS